MTLATAPPFLITRWIRPVGWMCSRISDIACSNSSIASSALRPSHGEAAAWAVLPKNSTSEALSAKRLPTAMTRRTLGEGRLVRFTRLLRQLRQCVILGEDRHDRRARPGAGDERSRESNPALNLETLLAEQIREQLR